MKPTPQLFAERVTMPRAFSISAPRDAIDFTPHAKDYAVEIKFAYRTNAVIVGPDGREKLSGWHESAATKATVFVNKPTNEAAALCAVRDMAREIGGATLRAFLDAPEYLRPIATGIPCGFRIVGTPRVVNRPRPRACGYITDVIDATRDAWARTRAALESLPAEGGAK